MPPDLVDDLDRDARGVVFRRQNRRTNQEVVIAALEGLKYQGLTGEEEVRKADHQVLKNYYLLKGKAKSKMKNKDDYVDVLSSGKSFLPIDQTGCKRA